MEISLDIYSHKHHFRCVYSILCFEEHRLGNSTENSTEGVRCLACYTAAAKRNAGKMQGQTLGKEIARLPEEQPDTVRAHRVRPGHIFSESARPEQQPTPPSLQP